MQPEWMDRGLPVRFRASACSCVRVRHYGAGAAEAGAEATGQRERACASARLRWCRRLPPAPHKQVAAAPRHFPACHRPPYSAPPTWESGVGPLR